MKITSEQLVKLGAKREDAYLKYGEELFNTMEMFKINTPERISHFLSQVYHESIHLSKVNEGLSYSAERLCKVYKDKFRTLEEARPYARNSKELSMRLYDGYHGRGLIQLTHKYNYKDCGDFLGVDFVSNPQLLEEPKYACLSAGWFWHTKKLNSKADIGGVAMVRSITRTVNGGLNGYEDRLRLYLKAKEIFK
jgi:putative chitinase